MNSNSIQIVWLKKDLRLSDHEPLKFALKSIATHGKILLLYCFDPEIISQPDQSLQHFNFTLECLQEIKSQLEQVQGLLCIKQGSFKEILSACLKKRISISQILAYKETSQFICFQKDQEIRTFCKKAQIPFIEFNQNGVKRGSDFKKDGFSFNSYLKEILSNPPVNWPYEEVLIRPSTEVWAPWPLGTFFEFDFKFLSSLCLEQDKPFRLKGGFSQANQLLTQFFSSDHLRLYPKSISSPLTAQKGCSRLSPYLSFGVISQKQLIDVVRHLMSSIDFNLSQKQQESSIEEGVRFFIERLYWRSSYLQRFELDPSIEFENKNRST